MENDIFWTGPSEPHIINHVSGNIEIPVLTCSNSRFYCEMFTPVSLKK